MATQETIKQLNVGGVLRDVEDVTARGLISSLQTALNALTSGDTTTAIESFNEIVAFLENVSDSSTLQGIIAGLNTSIAAKYTKPETGIPSTDLAQAVQTILNDVANKVDVVNGKGLSTNDFTNEWLTKLNDLSNYNDTALQTAVSNLQTALQNVYTKSQTYNKNEVDTMVANAQGTQGPKGDTGSVQVDGNGNVLIYNGLDMDSQGAALDASQGFRLALLSGTYEQAWQRSKVVTTSFCWLWNETIDGDLIKKPIWHIGSSVFVDAVGSTVSAAQASAVPASPTMTSGGNAVADNSSVAKNTQLTITPESGSVLYYRVGSSGSYTASLTAVTLTLSTSGATVISAYCANTKGNSSPTTLNLTVEGLPVPSFAPKSGTTIDSNDVVSRGGYVVITGEAGGTLHYKVGSGSYQDVTGVGGAAPSVEVQITAATTITAYNTIDSEDSSEVTKNYTMDALDAPTFSPAAGQLPVGGDDVELDGPAGVPIYYTMTTDGTTPADPTDQSTLYNGVIAVNVATTIKAIAKDDYGYSAVAQAAYTIREAGITVKTNAATTMTMTKTDDTTVTKNLVSGENFFTMSELGGSGTNGNEFKGFAFGDKTALLEVDFGGAIITGTTFSFTSATNLTSLTNFATTGSLTTIDMTGCYALETFDFSGIAGFIAGINTVKFKNTKLQTIDISMADFDGKQIGEIARSCSLLTKIIFNKCSNITGFANAFTNTGNITTLVCKATTPPTFSQDKDWLGALAAANQNVFDAIKVPSSAVENYKSASGWSTYANLIVADDE